MKHDQNILSRLKHLSYLAGILLLMTLQGCMDSLNSFQSKPTALGQSSEIIVISDQDLMEGAIGDSVRFYFGGAFPMLPQPEPLFDVRHFTPQELKADPLRRELRTYLILADLSDKESPATQMVIKDLGEEKIRRAKEDPEYFSTVGRHRWADGQLIVYIFGQNEEKLGKNIVRGFPAVAKRVTQHDYKQMDATVFVHDESDKIRQKLMEKFGFEMRVPGEYQMARSGKDFLWIRKDTRDINSSFMIATVPYINQDQFTKESIMSAMDSLGIRYVSTNETGSYLRTTTEFLPAFAYEKKIAGHYAVEVRGVWEMHNDFMGGPYASYAILDEAKNRIIYIHGFVYAPSKKKRIFVQAIEHIVGTAEI